MFTILLSACFEAVVKCYEKAVKQSGQQLKAVSPVKDAAQFRRQLDGKERLPMRDLIEAMPDETARYFFLNLVVEFGFPTEVVTATAIGRRMEKAS